MMTDLSGKKILMGVTGGIAAYKVAELIRLLKQAGAEVRVVMTQQAQQFITALTLQTLSGHPVYTDLFAGELSHSIDHIALARWPDFILIVPATANCLARLAQGMADDLLTTICLATYAPLLIAPAMNQAMWHHPATQHNVRTLETRSVMLLPPAVGEKACGEWGEGRLMDLPDILDQLSAFSQDSKLLQGQRVVVTAGPTHEYFDPVRYLSNPSSGKMGYALAAAAAQLGAQVSLISGPSHLLAPTNVHCIRVTTALDMQAAVQDQLPCDIFIGAAAVSDYRAESIAPRKLKRSSQSQTVSLIPNPDILKAVATGKDRPFTVAFAAETHEDIAMSLKKLKTKNADLLLLNEVGPNKGFAVDSNQVKVITAAGTVNVLPRMHKRRLAQQILHIIVNRLNAKHLNSQDQDDKLSSIH